MLTNMMNVRGVLSPTKPEAVEAWTQARIRTEFKGHGLWWAMRDSLGEGGVVEIDSSLKTYETHHSAMAFINRLREFIRAEDVLGLGLKGHLLITGHSFEKEELVILQVNVRNGNVYYQDGHIQWESERAVR